MQPLYFPHYTLTTCLGAGRQRNWDAIAAQRSGLQPCMFETAWLPTFIGQVAGVEDQQLPEHLSSYQCRNNQLAQLALEQDGFADAVRAALHTVDRSRIGVFIGTSTAGILNTEIAYRHRANPSGALPADFHYRESHNTYSVSSFVRDYFDLQGPSLAVSSACSSSAKVFANACRMLECGLIDGAIVGGVDSLCLTTLYGFNSLELLSSQPCRPFDADRNGISISEAAGFAWVTRSKLAGHPTMAVTGMGESSDAHHMSSPHPEGAGALAAMRQALRTAALEPAQIGYVNAHGTATPSNDSAEGLAIHSLFGPDTPCSSTKGHTGHALGAAGIVEVALGAMAIKYGMLPGGVHTQSIDPALDVNYLLKNLPATPHAILTNSFGFGGSNCSLVIEQR